jgi:glycosyltransferase involved in cell wall biosynthesis
MRILLITDNHFLFGGAENYFFDLKSRLKALPDFQVYSLGFGPQEIIGDDFLVLKSLRSKLGKLIGRVLFHPMIYNKLRNYIKKINPDVIHLHNTKQYTASLLQAIKPYPIVQTIHDFSYLCPNAQNIHRNRKPCATGFCKACFWQHQIKYNKLAYLFLIFAFLKTRKHCQKMIKKFIVPSPYLANYLKQNHFHEVTFIPPFTVKKQNPSFTEINTNQFLFAGYLGAHKGVHILIDEFALACQKKSSLKLCIAGIGPEEKWMKKRIKALGIEKNVEFLGWQTEMDKLYNESLAVIFPSIGLEAFGLVMTEGMDHARPIIGTNRGTSAWIIDDEHTGLLFEPHIKGDLAAKILTIASNIEQAMALGMNGYQKLHHYFIDNDENLKRITAVYKAAVCGKSRGDPVHSHGMTT